MTSLSQQLKKLAVPQTSSLQDKKKRPSIIFDPKEAATKDRQTIFDLGCQGLSELITLNQDLAKFKDTLFQHTSLNIERSVEDSAFNRELDLNIKKFFHHLSPYFMLRPSHLCLEWLIRRFQVHEYNKEAFIALILPYHETNIFVRCVQILRVKGVNDPWHWLSSIQKPGVPLPKSAIFNRAASEPSFLQFVCKSVIDATKELGSRAPTLQCLINFYCMVVIGAFENCNQIKEWHVTSILPSIIKGLKSGVVDFISASLMITTQLVNKTNLTPKLLHVLITHIWKIDCETLQSTSLLLLNWIAKTHADVLTQFPKKGFVEFIENAWLNNAISNLSRDGISMIYLTIPLIGTAFDILQNDMNNAEACRRYIEGFLFEVQFNKHSAKVVIKCVLEGLSLKELKKEQQKPNDGDVIDLESDSEMPSQANVMNWFTKVIQILERQYPSEMDEVIKEAMESGSSENSKNGIKIALAYRYKFLNEDTSSTFEKMYHVNPKIRSISVKEIIKQIDENELQSYNILKEVLADRINDDSEDVVQETLKLPTDKCIKMIGIKSFVENIIKILDKATTNPTSWAFLQTAALTHLTSDIVVKDYDSNIILLAVSRYLIPIKNDQENAKFIKIILQSSLAEKKPFLQTLAKKYRDKKIDLDDFKKDFLDILSMSDDTPNAEDLVQSMKKNGEDIFKTPIQMSHFLIMVTVCLKKKNDIERANNIYDFTMNQCSHFRIASLSNDISNTVPLSLLIDFLNSLVRGTNFESLQDWKSCSKSLTLFLRIFNLLILKAYSSKAETNEKQEWIKGLRDILNLIFPTTKQKLSFLSQFLVHGNLDCAENYTETRIRAVRLLEAILRGGKVESNDIDLRLILKIIVALSSPLSTVRECALDVLRAVKGFKEDMSKLIGNIIERSEEIQFDPEQIALVLFTILSTKRKTSDNSIVVKILNIIDDPAESNYFKSRILEILKHIKSANILNSMIPAALLALEDIQTVGNTKILNETTASILRSVIIRFDVNCIQEVISTNKDAWQLIEKSFKLSKVFINLDGKLSPVPCIILEIFDEETYKQLPNACKIKLLNLIIETISSSDNDALFLDVNKVLKKCSLDCKHVLPVFESMNDNSESAVLQKKKKSISRVTTVDMSLLNSSQWKKGIVLLEILENKKKLQNSQVLIPVLFDILKRCLDMEVQAPAEYTKQLILSALLQCCQKSEAENLLCKMPESIFRIDLIVQCIRSTQNPQTHYNALLLLSHCAVLFPQQVLHNLVDIFTFMGSSIARHDDAFSFQIISNIVESIIPILVEDNKSNVAKNKRVVSVLKIFSDILLDVPEHRRTPLYTKLLSTLGAEEYFWLFICAVFESHVIKEEKNKSHNESTATGEKLPKRIEIVLNLLNEFTTSVSIQTCTSLLAYVKRLPMKKEEGNGSTMPRSNLQDSPDNELFKVNERSARQLRHYKYLILQFVSTFTSSADFLRSISVLNEEQNRQNKSLYQGFIIKTLSYIPDVTSAIEKSTEASQLKFWKVIQHHCYDALDNVISLLSPDIFLIAVHGLMQHKLVTIRKKVIDLLISKLQQKIDYFEECSDENVLNLLNSLCELVGTIAKKDHNNSHSATKTSIANETILLQQTGLIAIKLLSRQFAMKYQEQFKNIIEHLTKRSQLPKVVLATVILTLVELISNLKAQGIAHLPRFMRLFIEALNEQSIILQKQSPDNVCLALMTGIQKLFESMPLFLGPYIVGIVTALSTMWSHIKHRQVEQDQKSIVNINKLEAIWKKIATEVPARILIPNCENAYYALINDGNFSSISFVMKLFFECVSNASDSDLSAVQLELTNFFLKCLEFRSQIQSSSSSSTSRDDICSTEMEIINAFVAWILKLSESSFRPVYKKVYDWGFEKNGPKERVLTYFILNRCISNSLKSLFILFSSDFIKDAANLLTTYNTTKNTVLYFENSDELNGELLKNILCTLTNIFVYDSNSFANPHRFDILMQPIVDQLENKLIIENEELQGILLLCIGQLAVAVSSDVLWKQLHYQILLKTRSNMPEVRIISFNCCVELARKLGDDFTSLLPETVPFIAELFEDENAIVVKNSRRAVQELEAIIGESLQKYL